jgi:dolichyl-phosphate-mannose-protein mannosyltransferase
MAEPDAASTGARFAPDLRRRNVPGADKASIVHSPDMADEQKKTRHASNSYVSALLEWEHIIAPIILTAFSVFTRMYRIGRSNIVTWDEAQ